MRDADATRGRILDAALAEFAAHGIAGARVNRIATRAGANKERIYAHFGDKQSLFDTVMARALTEVAEAVPMDTADLPAYVGEVFDYLVTHVELARLATWARLETSGVPLADDDPRLEIYRTEKIGQIQEAQRAGLVDVSWEPIVLISILTALSAAWIVAPVELHQLAQGVGIPLAEHRKAAVDAARLIVGNRKPDARSIDRAQGPRSTQRLDLSRRRRR